MQKVYSATSYFIIGYTVIAAIITSLSFLPSLLRGGLGMILAAVVFVDMSYRFLKKNYSIEKTVSSKTILYLMTYWSLLSISLDVLIFVVILPLIATGKVNLIFFSQQSFVYWLQFPMFYVFGFASQAIYKRVTSITTTNIDRIR